MGSTVREAYGSGIATVAERDDTVLEVWFHSFGLEAIVASEAAAPERDRVRRVRFVTVDIAIDLDRPPADAADAYLRLHLLSGRVVEPNSVALEGIFGVLATVAWTDLGPVHVADLGEIRARKRHEGQYLSVHSLDKLPRMLDLVNPDGIRIADANRVRLGAHLAPGTVVMHEGLVNYNAGTLGTSMVEGRITQGSVVEEGADIGAGSSIMGTLSGGGTNVLRIGRGALLGANAGVGISLGANSAVEAGLYVTRGTLVTLPDGNVVKAAELDDVPGILLRRHSATGVVQAVPWKSNTFTGLNPDLHQS
ncbi:DapH/DapD/GlmU-related protein [Nocardia sp. NPDC046763]|uniref:DapH/DapD/GlmU-related protein n=1 Tax=Nocardia sp. NPDC046763 TaxID=3155256 RepID=UPI0033F133F3